MATHYRLPLFGVSIVLALACDVQEIGSNPFGLEGDDGPWPTHQEGEAGDGTDGHGGETAGDMEEEDDAGGEGAASSGGDDGSTGDDGQVGDGTGGDDGASEGDTGDEGDDGGGTPAPAPIADVPDSATCFPASLWDDMARAFEEEVLVRVNEIRATGANCGGVTYSAVPPLTMEPSLRCAARLHSRDMAQQSYFGHTSLDGRTPYDRVLDAGYSAGYPIAENIAAGQASPEDVVISWMESAGHCVNVMRSNVVWMGVGYFEGTGTYGRYWTQTFGGA